MSTLKNLTYKVKTASDKTETKQNKFYRKDIGPLRKKARWQLDKKVQKSKDKKTGLYF